VQKNSEASADLKVGVNQENQAEVTLPDFRALTRTLYIYPYRVLTFVC
jgi:hypothetical protein